MEGMRPAARVLLTSVIPAFSDAGAGKDLGGRLDKLIEELRPYDEPLAGALQALMSAQAGGVKRAPPAKDGALAAPEEKSREKSLESVSGLFAPPAGAAGVAAGAPLIDMPELAEAPALSALDLSSHSPPPVVDASALIAAMLVNLAPAKNEYESALPRLAHVAAAAQAELALIEEAKTSARARRLLAQLETIKTCEQGLY